MLLLRVRSKNEGGPKVVSFSNAVKKKEEDERSFKSDTDFSEEEDK